MPVSDDVGLESRAQKISNCDAVNTERDNKTANFAHLVEVNFLKGPLQQVIHVSVNEFDVISEVYQHKCNIFPPEGQGRKLAPNKTSKLIFKLVITCETVLVWKCDL